jgi:hypothetical protein
VKGGPRPTGKAITPGSQTERGALPGRSGGCVAARTHRPLSGSWASGPVVPLPAWRGPIPAAGLES